MARTVLIVHREYDPKETLFECTREDFYKYLFCNDVVPVRAETDGRIILVIYIRKEAEPLIKAILDPNRVLSVDYRKSMIASESWKIYLQLFSDYKAHRE